MFKKLVGRALELPGKAFGWVLYGIFLIIVPLLLTYMIWSGMFSFLPDHTIKFALLVIPAIIGSIMLLSWAGNAVGLVDYYDNQGTTSRAAQKTAAAQNFLKVILLIVVLAAEIGLGYFYPAPFIDDRGYRTGNGFSSGYGASGATNHSSDNNSSNQKRQWFKKSSAAWDCFEEKNRIGDSYSSISNDYPNMTDSGNSGGGVLLQASDELYFVFPALSKSQISDTDLCTGMTGTLKELFGYENNITVNDFKQDLGLTSETKYDSNLCYKKTSSSGYYYVIILSVYIENDADAVTPDTWISVIQRNREIVPVGELSSGRDTEKETVFYVEGGDCYHKNASCSTLHDSDIIYECYIEESPDGRTPCGVCY